MRKTPKVRIIRMRKVPFIDSTGIHNLEILIESSHKEGIKVVLSGVNESVRSALEKAHIDGKIPECKICSHISEAVEAANALARE